MPGEDDGDGPRGQLPPFTPPRFNWNQDNLYEQFTTSKELWNLHSKDSMRSVQTVSNVVLS